MKMAFKKCVFVAFLIALIMITGRLWYVAKDGFHMNRICYPLPAKVIQEPAISTLFKGSYHYLGRGRQCYVFESVDHCYVLKIPRFDRYSLPFFWKAMPSFYDSKKRAIFKGRQDRLHFTMNSFYISGTDLQKETSVLYLHFHKTKHLPKVKIYDRLHRPYLLDLNSTAFILQEKKELMMPLFLQALKENNRELAEKMLFSFLDVVDQRAQKGIFNRDPSFLKNFGWDGEKCIQIDIGSFWRKSLPSRAAYGASMLDGCVRIRDWLAMTDPDMLDRFNRKLDEKLSSIPQ